MSKIIFVLLVLTAIVACGRGLISSVNSPSQHTALSDAQVEREEFAVYDLIINSKCIPNSEQLLVIQKETALGSIDESPVERLRYVQQRLPEIQPSLVQDFSKKNTRRYTLNDAFNPRIHHVLASTNALEPMLKQPDFWKEFYKRFPGAQGMVSLSRVGFNTERNQALVYIATATGPDSGGAYYVLLSKKGNLWTIQADLKVFSV